MSDQRLGSALLLGLLASVWMFPWLAAAEDKASAFPRPDVVLSPVSLRTTDADQPLHPAFVTKKGALRASCVWRSATEAGCQDVIVQPQRVDGGRVALGVLLNIFLPFAIGSWVTGDLVGGIVGTSGHLAGTAVIVAGLFTLRSSVILVVVGSILSAIGLLFPLVSVLLHTLNPPPRRILVPIPQGPPQKTPAGPQNRAFSDLHTPTQILSF